VRAGSLITIAVLMLGVAIYSAGVPGNPPGFHIDESSIAFNAHLIATSGHDEHGASWPLFFRAFTEYKNPVYIYLLAAVFKVTGPSILSARLLSAILGVATAFVLGVLARRTTGRHEALPIVMLMALLTPWLFSVSRLVFEVALFPLVIALFLLALHHAATRERWRIQDAAMVAAALALATYTYSIGRLMGPLLAVGLVLFITNRERMRGVLSTWAFYVFALVPAYVFHREHPNALTGRFSIITYLDSQAPYSDTVLTFFEHYIRNFNLWRMVALGDTDIYHLTYVDGCGLLLTLTAALALVGACRAIMRKPRDRWWLYLLYGLLVAPIPASLTNSYFHSLRLSAVPVFFIALSALGLEWFLSTGEKRNRLKLVVLVLVMLMLAQGLLVLFRYHADQRSAQRLHLFDGEFKEKIFDPAVRSSSRPIYIADVFGVPGYIQAYWYATLDGIPLDQFVRLPYDALPPNGALTITTEEYCLQCDVLAECSPYILYMARGEPRQRAPLSAGGHRAALAVVEVPRTLSRGASGTVVVRVRNEGDAVWMARERAGGKYQVTLGNHWLDEAGGMVVNDDARQVLRKDLAPGEAMELKLNVRAPRRAGNYLLELDMLEEGVTWFGLRGSPTLRLPVNVE
jgi:4-amino-4-deoxy-L-arabinose transferase-like glycosyltransferase